MKMIGNGKVAAVSALTGAVLVVGGLFFGASLVSAADPTPTPGQEQVVPGTTTPGTTPSDGTRGDNGECDEMDGSGGSAPGSTGATTGASGGGMGRGIRQ